MLGHSTNTPGTLIVATKDSGLLGLEEPISELLKKDDEELEAYFEPNKEVPLLTAVAVLAKLAKVNLLIDPKIKSGGVRYVGTNIVDLPPVSTNTVSLSSFGGVSPQQTLEAVLNNFGLILISDPRTRFSQVTFKDPSAKDPVFNYVIQLHYSSTTNMVTLFQSAFPLAKILPNTRTAQLVVSSTQKDYQNLTNLLASIDTPTKQVLIEARFLETIQNPKSAKGLDWTDTLSAQHFSFGNGKIAGTSTRTLSTDTPGAPTTTTLPSGRPVTISPSSSSAENITKKEVTTIGAGGLTASTASGFNPSVAFLNADGVNAALSFLNTELDSKLLATPRAVTLDNQETRLEVTRAIPIFDSSEGVGSGGTTVSSTKPNYTNVGTILIVTPRISGTNISLKLKPEISKVEGQPSRKVINGKVNEADIFSTSRIDTQVVIPSGHTLVMGGLVSDSTAKNYAKVPILGDLPILGWAFRHETKERLRSNLIIFLTPTIIEFEDFQATHTEFLNTKVPENSDEIAGPMNSGKSAADIKKARKQASVSPSGDNEPGASIHTNEGGK